MGPVRRGDVFWIKLDHARGAEIKKTRPCVVVSNDIANNFSSLVTVVPVTTQKLSRVYPFEVLLPPSNQLKNSKVKANQIRTIDKGRLEGKILSLTKSTMAKIDQALALHLDLILKEFSE